MRYGSVERQGERFVSDKVVDQDPVKQPINAGLFLAKYPTP